MLVCGEWGWGALLTPLSPDSVHQVAWRKIVSFFINLFVPQSLIWGGKKMGMDPVVESNLGVLHAAWCYTFLDIYLSGCQCFHSHPAATPGRRKQAQVSAGKLSLFPFKKPSKTGKLAVLVHLAPWVQHNQPHEAAREEWLHC